MNKVKSSLSQFKALTAILVVCLVVGISAAIATPRSEAYADTPTVITTPEQLDGIRNNLSGNYILGADIDLSQYNFNNKTWTARNGWDGIGSSEAKGFRGTLDGDGFTIRGLWSNGRVSNQGLFGWIVGGTVKNLNIELAPNSGILGVGERRAALAGDVYSGATIENITITGNNSRIEGSANYIAGVAGVVKKSSVSDVKIDGIYIKGGSYVGGVAGVIYDKSVVSTATVLNMNLDAAASYVGGAIGCIYGGSQMTDSTVEDITINAKTSYAGGFVGAIHEKGSSINNGLVKNANVTAKVSYVGGFAGVIYHYADVTRACVVNGNATAVDGRSAGGFTGELYDFGTAENCFANDSSAQAKFYVGGWSGAIYGKAKVNNAAAAGVGEAKTTYGYVSGGFAGYTAYCDISNAFSQVDVSTMMTGGTGGFIGFAEIGTSVYNTYTSSKVTNYGKYSAFYDGAYSGYTYATFSGTNFYDKDINPSLQGYGTGGIKSGSPAAYPQGKSTAEMFQQATFVGWDFNSMWVIADGISYPNLKTLSISCATGSGAFSIG